MRDVDVTTHRDVYLDEQSRVGGLRPPAGCKSADQYYTRGSFERQEVVTGQPSPCLFWIIQPPPALGPIDIFTGFWQKRLMNDSRQQGEDMTG